MCFLHYYMTEEKTINDKDSQTGNLKITDIFNVFKVNRAFVALCIHGLFICFMQNFSLHR